MQIIKIREKRKAEMSEKLQGNSGCGLYIFNSDNTIVVEKWSPNEEYNCRLQSQCKKQIEFEYNKFRKVDVLQTGCVNRRFFFRMKYINGKSLAEQICDIDLTELCEISKKILTFIPKNVEFDVHAKDIFRNKVKELDMKIKNKSIVVQESFQQLYTFEWQYVQKSKCHGDLTLENILCGEDGYYLIDFLDSFYDSWMIDFAKILQDIELFWHYRNSIVDNNLYIRLMILKHQLIKKVNKMKYGKEILQSIYMMLLLNVLRIIPYAKDNNTNAWIEEKCKYLNEKGKNK